MGKENSNVSAVDSGSGPTGAAPRKRRLKPEVAERLLAERAESRLAQLYARRVDDLSPEELELMKANFLRG